jgi:hypothetical protein
VRAVGPLAFLALFALAGCSAEDPVAASGSSVAPAAAVEVSSAAVSPSVAEASVPAAEPFSLLIHCGGTEANFAGRDWVASTSMPQVTVVHSDGNSETVNYIDGTMTRVADDLLRFTIADPKIVETGKTVDFVPADQPPVSHCE